MVKELKLSTLPPFKEYKNNHIAKKIKEESCTSLVETRQEKGDTLNCCNLMAGRWERMQGKKPSGRTAPRPESGSRSGLARNRAASLGEVTLSQKNHISPYQELNTKVQHSTYVPYERFRHDRAQTILPELNYPPSHTASQMSEARSPQPRSAKSQRQKSLQTARKSRFFKRLTTKA